MPARFRRLLLLTAIFLCAAGVSACAGDVIYDDYRQSRLIVRGTVSDPAGYAVSAAVIELTFIRSLVVAGDTVLSNQAGAFTAELSSMGVGTFEGEVQLRARAPNGATQDTILRGVRMVEERPRGRQPDTVTVMLRLPSS